MTSGEKLRLLIVDDEPLARRGIRNQILRQQTSVDIVGECSNGRDAVEAIRRLSPDLVFLDIQMPELDGFEVVKAIGVEQMPAVVFVTAYDRYALQAFEVHALDYILKPIDPDRFCSAFDRAVKELGRMGRDDFTGRLDAVLRYLEDGREPAEEKTWQERLLVKDAGRIFFVDTVDVSWIDSAGNYVRLHIGRRTPLLRETMDGMERKLDPRRFIRIRRSTLVNIEAIKEFKPLAKGTYLVVLHDGTELASSRNYRANLDDLFQRSS
jgi:two-component system LytT family response regulator